MNSKIIHEKALTLAKRYKIAQAELLDVLQEIDSKKIFRSFGYNSLWDYCLRGLLLSESDADTFIRVARKSQSIPLLKQLIQKGEISLSAARRVCSVITVENHKGWLEKAKTLNQRELEREIVKENPKAKVPDKLKPLAPETTELHCSISSEVEALIRKVQDLESKRQRRNCTLEMVFKEMATVYLEKKDPIRKSVRKSIEKHRNGSKDQALPQESFQPAAQNSKPQSGTRRIPNHILRDVNQRDKGRCVFVGETGHRCGQARFTEIHHIRPYSISGGHELENLATLCSVHRMPSSAQNIWGESPLTRGIHARV